MTTDKELAEEARKWDTREITTAGWQDAPSAVVAKPSYTGLILDDPQSLAKAVEHLVPDGWQMQTRPQPGFFPEILPHHMTSCIGRLPEEYCHLLNKKFDISVVAWGKTDKAMAVLVESLAPRLDDGPKHITVAISNKGKPFDSNAITEWFPINPFICYGTMLEVFRQKHAVCVDNTSDTDKLTTGKSYVILKEQKYKPYDNKLSYLIRCNNNCCFWFLATKFVLHGES